MAAMVAGLLEDNVRDFASRAAAARVARGSVVLEACDRGIAVTVSFRRGAVTVTDGAQVGAPLIAAEWLEMARICSGQRPLLAAILCRKAHVLRGKGMTVLPAAAVALTVPRSFYDAGHSAQVSKAMRRRSLWMRTLASAAVIMAFAVIVMGSVVRTTDSGMGCSSWPLCNGHVGPITSLHPLLEQVHRYAVALLVMLVVATVALAWRRPRASPFVVRAALLAAGLLVLQALLGMVTVLAHNAPATVALHVLFAEVLLGVLVAVLVGTWRAQRSTPKVMGPDVAVGAGVHARRVMGSLEWWTLVGVLAVIASGSAVTDGGASAACRAWPLCGTDGHPAHLVAIQFIHRGAVLVLSVLLVVLVVRAWRSWGGVPGARPLAAGVAVLLAAQIASGAVVAVLGAPGTGQDVHLALASALWSCTVALVTTGGLARRSPGSSRSTMPSRSADGSPVTAASMPSSAT